MILSEHGAGSFLTSGSSAGQYTGGPSKILVEFGSYTGDRRRGAMRASLSTAANARPRNGMVRNAAPGVAGPYGGDRRPGILVNAKTVRKPSASLKTLKSVGRTTPRFSPSLFRPGIRLGGIQRIFGREYDEFEGRIVTILWL